MQALSMSILKKWHEANLTPYLLTLLRGETKYGSLKYLDQDALNIAFNMNNIYLAKDFDTIYTLKTNFMIVVIESISKPLPIKQY